MRTIKYFSDKPCAIRNQWINKNIASIELTQAVETFLAAGGRVKTCKPAKYYSERKRGSAVLGPTTQGRAGLYGGLRHIYSK